jgi:hypothetical protein
MELNLCTQRAQGRTVVHLAVLFLFLFPTLWPVKAQEGRAPHAQLMQRMEEINRFVRERTGYKAMTLPKVIILAPDQMESMRYGAGWRGKGYPEVVALAKKGVIFLPSNFQIGRDDYILAHELTLYQEFESGKHWECNAAMEPEAYRVQNMWVEATGRGQKADLLGPLALSDCGLNP